MGGKFSYFLDFFISSIQMAEWVYWLRWEKQSFSSGHWFVRVRKKEEAQCSWRDWSAWGDSSERKNCPSSKGSGFILGQWAVPHVLEDYSGCQLAAWAQSASSLSESWKRRRFEILDLSDQSLFCYWQKLLHCDCYKTGDRVCDTKGKFT